MCVVAVRAQEPFGARPPGCASVPRGRPAPAQEQAREISAAQLDALRPGPAVQGCTWRAAGTLRPAGLLDRQEHARVGSSTGASVASGRRAAGPRARLVMRVLRVRLHQRCGRAVWRGMADYRRRAGRRSGGPEGLVPDVAHRGTLGLELAAGHDRTGILQRAVVAALAVAARYAFTSTSSTVACGTRSPGLKVSSWRMVSRTSPPPGDGRPTSAPSTAPGTRCRRCHRHPASCRTRRPWP